MGTKGSHTRAFPEKMVKDILSCSPKAETVLDPFAGSGTVGVACKNLNRNYILIEREPEYCQIDEERLNNLPTPDTSSVSDKEEK